MLRLIKLLFLFVGLLVFCSLDVVAQPIRSDRTTAQQVADDLAWVKVYRKGLGSIVLFAQASPELYAPKRLDVAIVEPRRPVGAP